MKDQINETKTHCDGCDNHCSADELKCGKGRRIFGLADEGEGGCHGEHGGPGRYGEHGGHGEHGGPGRYGEHGGHGEHGGRGRQQGFEGRFLADEEQLSLSDLLGRCGYIADKKSGKQRGQAKILRILSHHTQMTQRELQEILNVEPGSMSEIVSKLEEKGYITRSKDETDRRRMVVYLTEAGRAAAGDAGGKAGSEDYFSVLTDSEKEQLHEILLKLLKQWKQERKTWDRGGRSHE